MLRTKIRQARPARNGAFVAVEHSAWGRGQWDQADTCGLKAQVRRQATLRDVVSLVRELFDLRPEPARNSLEPRAWDTTTWRADITRIRSLLGWAPHHTLSSGLAAFGSWLGQNPDVAARYRAATPRAAGR